VSEDALLDEFEDESFWGAYREQRIQELKKQAAKESLKGDGAFTELADEKEFLKITTTTKRVICHFYHKEFIRCKIMDDHLQVLAAKYLQTKFVKIQVEIAPFFVEKLKIKVLPCVLCFVDGVVVERIVGFEDISTNDSFPTQLLERSLTKSGVLK